MIRKLNLMKRMKAQAMPFNWIFVIVVGGVIIFLAVFATSRYINLQRYSVDTTVAAQLSVLLNPLETTTASATTTRLDLSRETRLQLSCKFTGLGRQDLRIVTHSGVGEEWQEYGSAVSMHNKYIFSRDLEQGKKIYLFSKTFSMPFKVADLIYLTTKDFCFVDAPEAIVSELRDLDMENVQVVRNKNDCKKDVEVRTVCFGRPGCHLNVYGQCLGYDCSSSFEEYDYGFVENRERTGGVEILYYVTPELLYAALFSSPEIYKCNLHRLMYRINLVSRLYIEKTSVVKTRGCNTGSLNDKLGDLALHASSLTRSDNPIQIKNTAKSAEDVNSGLICRMF